MGRSSSSIRVLKGPWKGIELRENLQSPAHYEIGVNVTLERGYLEARKALSVVGVSISRRARLHYVDRPGLPRKILTIGPTGSPGYADSAIEFRALEPDGSALEDFQDLSSTFGEPQSDRFRCSFVDTFLKSTTGKPRPVTLIVTRYNTYVYEPSIDPYNVRVLDTSADSLQVNGDNFSYWVTRPRGGISCVHQSKVYYAGFSEDFEAVLDNPLEDDQNAIAEALIGTGRASIGLGPSALVWSDEFDPAGIRADHFVATESHERITGLHSTSEALYVFTSKSIYALSGYSDETYVLTRVSTGVGCVSHTSILQVGQVIYYLAADGYYAFGGVQAPETVKLTTGLDALFTGGWDKSQVPSAIVSKLSTLGYPWTVEHADLQMSCARYFASANQIWISLPVTGRTSRSFPVTLVYDLVSRGFNLYTMTPSARTDGSWVTPMYDAVSVKDGSRERWLTSNGIGEIQEYGGSYRDGVTGSFYGVPLIWLSSRLQSSNDVVAQFGPVRFKMLGTGKTPSTNAPTWFAEGEEAASDQQNDLGTVITNSDDRQAVSGVLLTHPNVVNETTGTTSATYFYGTSAAAVWGTTYWTAVDWFTSTAKAGFSSRWLRLGFYDDGSTDDRTSLVVVQSISYEDSSSGDAH